MAIGSARAVNAAPQQVRANRATGPSRAARSRPRVFETGRPVGLNPGAGGNVLHPSRASAAWHGTALLPASAMRFQCAPLVQTTCASRCWGTCPRAFNAARPCRFAPPATPVTKRSCLLRRLCDAWQQERGLALADAVNRSCIGSNTPRRGVCCCCPGGGVALQAVHACAKCKCSACA